MLYARVVLGIPVEGPFDYIVPKNLEKDIGIGSRVWVNFGTQKKLAYIVSLSRKTRIKNLKRIQEIIDDYPILDKNMLTLTKEVSRYYCCSWGEAIETALPESLRKGKRIPNPETSLNRAALGFQEGILILDLDGKKRWDIYLTQIKETLSAKKSVIILLPDKTSVLNAKDIIAVKLDVSLSILYRKEPKELEEWAKIKRGEVNIVIGTRSGIFAPLKNLGLVIIDEEEDAVYKQDQVPHYHAREVAFMRTNIEKAKLILGSSSPSLESFYLAKKNKIKHILIPRASSFPEIKIIDMKFERRMQKRRIILSRYLQDEIISKLNSGAKTLLFLNRKGFATLSSCNNCGTVLKCPRCNINLVYHFKDNILNCHYCNFKMEPPNICPDCNAGYIKFTGIGTEKIESELSRIFPQARIKRLDQQKNLSFKDDDIFIATSSIIKKTDYNFGLVGALGIDNALNRIDFRAAEKAFVLLVGLAGLTDAKLLIQTNFPAHHCFQALAKNDINLFYKEELKQRRQLSLPPYKHLVLVKLRGKKEDKVKEASCRLFERLKASNKNKDIRIISANPGHPSKLRGNFYWQLLISCDNAKKTSGFLKIHLKDFSHSGIIVTVDVDPV